MKLMRYLSLIVFTLVFIIATPIMAVANPDSAPSISDIHANVYLLEDGDVLIYGQSDIPYASPPSVDVDETYIIRLVDTDNVTQLGSYVPYPQFDNGYNEGVFGIYFTAADNLTIDQPYIIRISQNPAQFPSPQSWDYVMSLNSWTNETTQDNNQTELTINIISIAEDLETAHDVTLLESSVGGTVLSDPTGETYFRGAIYGLQAMAPDLFLVQSLTWDTTDRAWTTDQFDAYSENLSGTFIDTATDNLSAAVGMDTPTLMTMIFVIPVMVGAAIVTSIKWRKIEPALLITSVILIMAVLMGWLNAALFALIFQLMAVYIGYLWFYSRAGDSMGGKMFSFLAFVWITSTLICLVIEGSWFSTTATGASGSSIPGPITIINDLSAFSSQRVGGIVPMLSAGLQFFRGLFRMLIWDYSFYSGNFVLFRYIGLIVLTGPAIYSMARDYVPVVANFLRIR